MLKLHNTHNQLSTSNKLSVIVIVKNRQTHLENTLRSLNTCSSNINEVVLVHMNQDIQPHLYNIAEEYSLIQYKLVIRDQDLPLAKARNIGAKLASSSILFFLDVDCIVESSTCIEYIKAIRQNPSNIYMSKCLYLEKPAKDVFTIYKEEAYEHPKRTLDTYPRWQLFWSLSFCITKKLFNEIGCFDEGFLNYGGEDTELSYRNYLAGNKLIWVPSSVVYHQPHESNELPFHHIQSVISNVNYFYTKHGFYIMESWIEGFEERGLILKQDNDLYKVL